MAFQRHWHSYNYLSICIQQQRNKSKWKLKKSEAIKPCPLRIYCKRSVTVALFLWHIAIAFHSHDMHIRPNSLTFVLDDTVVCSVRLSSRLGDERHLLPVEKMFVVVWFCVFFFYFHSEEVVENTNTIPR